MYWGNITTGFTITEMPASDPEAGGSQSGDEEQNAPMKEPEKLDHAMVTVSDTRGYVDTKRDRTAAISGIAKNNKKTGK